MHECVVMYVLNVMCNTKNIKFKIKSMHTCIFYAFK